MTFGYKSMKNSEIKANDEFIGPMDDEGFVSTCASYGIVPIVVNKSNEYWKREAQL